MRPELIEEAAHRFALLGDPTRLRILHALMERGELSVGDAAEAAGTSRFNASGHLNRLAQGGMVARRQSGTTHYYRVFDPRLGSICDWICEAVKERALALTGQRESPAKEVTRDGVR
jgi:DNA-binding transcriptional ArsR family regulator